MGSLQATSITANSLGLDWTGGVNEWNIPTVHALGLDHAVWQYQHGNWSSWQALSSSSGESKAANKLAVAQITGRKDVFGNPITGPMLEVFIIGLDNNIWHIWQDYSGNWQYWENLGSPANAGGVQDLTVANNQYSGALSLYVIGLNDNVVYYNMQSQPRSNWGGWQTLS